MLDPARRVKSLQVITILGAIVSIFMVYEFRMYQNFLDSFIRGIWPNWVPWDGSMSRFGFKRAAGSFGHPISAGYFFAMTTPIAFWLRQQGLFKDQRFASMILFLNALGVITSISRAPMMGLVVSVIIIWFGWSRYKSLSGGFLVVAAVIGLTIMVPKFVEYVSVSRAMATTQDQENAAYRKEMLDNYIEVIRERPVWGYGRYTYPIIKGQKSIDNEYLFIAITSGLANLWVYAAILITIFVRLFMYAIRHDSDHVDGRLAWVLLAAWISAIFTQATVYSGMQTTHYFFMIAAISEALVLNGKARFITTQSKSKPTEEVFYAYQFSRTL